MKNLNAKQVKKELQEILDKFAGSLNRYYTLSNALRLINSQEQKIFELENRLKECENGYEGTLFLDRCKLHDAEEKVKELTEENEKLRAENTDCRLGFTLLEDAFQRLEKINEQTEADTLENIKIQFAMRFGTYTDKDMTPITEVFRLLDQIAKEMLEGEK